MFIIVLLILVLNSTWFLLTVSLQCQASSLFNKFWMQSFWNCNVKYISTALLQYKAKHAFQKDEGLRLQPIEIVSISWEVKAERVLSGTSVEEFRFHFILLKCLGHLEYVFDTLASCWNYRSNSSYSFRGISSIKNIQTLFKTLMNPILYFKRHFPDLSAPSNNKKLREYLSMVK